MQNFNYDTTIYAYAQSLRDIADEDYIAARTLFYHNFWAPFIVSGQQCIEKYLKVILLFHKKTVKKTHNLESLFSSIQSQIPAINEFIKKYGEKKRLFSKYEILRILKTFQGAENIRYGIIPFHFTTQDLLDLDRLIFLLRSFAKKPSNYIKTYIIGQKLTGGYLEKILSKTYKPYNYLYTRLIWKNVYWGKNKKHFINGTFSSKSKNPSFTYSSEAACRHLSKYISLPDELFDYIKKRDEKK